MTSSPIDVLVAYATDLGLALHPTAADCRTPLLGRDKDADGREIPNTGGANKASKDPALIRDWWTRWPQANVACATGAPSGVWVLDVDVKGEDGRATLRTLQEDHGPLPETWVAKTPSGGRHIWFRFDPARPLRNRVGFAPGLDVRTTGGSITMPPSRKDGGAYRWLIDPCDRPLADAPGWLLELVDPPAPPLPPAKPLRVDSHERATRYVVAAVNSECGELARMGKGGRNLKLFQSSAQLGQLVGANLLSEQSAHGALLRAAEECGLLRDDGVHAVEATIRSGLTKGMANPRELTT